MPANQDSLSVQAATPAKILVIETLYLGDLVHTLPLIQALRARYPAARLDMLVRASQVDLMRHVAGVDRVLAMDPREHRSVRGLLALCRTLRASHYDLVLNPGASDRATLLTAFSGGRQRLGRLNRNQSAWLWPLLHDAVMHRAWAAEPMWWQKLTAFEQALGLSRTVGFGLDFSAPARPASSGAAPYIHISPFASEDIRSLAPSTLVELVARLRTALPQCELVISCGPSPRETTRLAAATPALLAAGARVCCGTLKLGELGALIQGAALHIGPDSGPLHLAAALGRPTIACFLFKDASAEWLPLGLQHRAFGVTTRLESGLYGLPLAEMAAQAEAVLAAHRTPAAVGGNGSAAL